MDFIFFGFKVTADNDYNHKTKRCLLLGRKVLTNADSVLKSNYLTDRSPIGKAMLLPVVIYGSESWTMKKAEH